MFRITVACKGYQVQFTSHSKTEHDVDNSVLPTECTSNIVHIQTIVSPGAYEVATVTTMDSQEPLAAVMMATCWLLNKVGANMQPYKARFGSAKFDRGWAN